MINQISKYYNGENMKYFPQKSKFKLSKKEIEEEKKVQKEGRGEREGGDRKFQP